MFETASKELQLLLKHLHIKHQISNRLLFRTLLQHSEEQDERNRKDPRAFCFVTEKSPTIYATLALDNLDSQTRVGVLLHEIGHLWLGAFGDAQVEVDVDEFCAMKVPESKYHYASCSYLSPWSGHAVLAQNIERVSPEFVALIANY